MAHPAGEAANKALNIPELFEMVIADSEVRQLLALQRVSRSWRDHIRASTVLKNQHWLTPDQRNAFAQRTLELNPIALQVIRQLLRFYPAPMTHAEPPTHWHHAEATWRQMLLFSPPCCTVQVYFNRNVRMRQKFDLYLIDDGGVRLSQV